MSKTITTQELFDRLADIIDGEDAVRRDLTLGSLAATLHLLTASGTTEMYRQHRGGAFSKPESFALLVRGMEDDIAYLRGVAHQPECATPDNSDVFALSLLAHALVWLALTHPCEQPEGPAEEVAK